MTRPRLSPLSGTRPNFHVSPPPAHVSPPPAHCDRYADSAKQIVNNARVNLDPNAALISDLKSEIETLRAALARSGSDVGASPSDGDEVAKHIEALEALEKLKKEAEVPPRAACAPSSVHVPRPPPSTCRR